MTDHNETAPASPPVSVSVSLAAIAMEMDTTVAAVESQVDPGDVFMVGGFRSITAFKARQLLEAHAERKAENERRAAENAERTRKYCAEAHASIPKSFTKYGLDTVAINPGTDGVLPVVAMTAGADPEYEGSTMTRRPSVVDWISGKGEGGREIGPTRAEMQKAAKAAKAAKGKGKGTP
jgi:hypothetical protein